MSKPVKLKGERVWRTYLGGGMIPCLYGKEPEEDGFFPEEWMYSVTSATNAGRETIEEGLSKLDDGSEKTLKEFISSNPERILGTEHVKRWGITPGVLIKIIDSKERLTIQVHPDKKMAKELFHSLFGKTECWHILKTRKSEESAHIYLGFKPGITKEIWKTCFENQDYETMLSLLNKIPVKSGDTYLISGGVPHAIGAGCLLIEIQEPTDYTVRVERITPSGYQIPDYMCHQGLGFETMFDCFSYNTFDEADIVNNFCITPKVIDDEHTELIGYEDTPCFRMEKQTIRHICVMKSEPVFYCLYILSGRGNLEFDQKQIEIKAHDQFFVPLKSEEYLLSAYNETEDLVILKIYGPQI